MNYQMPTLKTNKIHFLRMSLVGQGWGCVCWKNSAPDITQGSRLREALSSVAATPSTQDPFGLLTREKEAGPLNCPQRFHTLARE